MLTKDIFNDMVKAARIVDPRKVVGIWAVPRLRRDATVEEWVILGVVTMPCAMGDPARLP